MIVSSESVFQYEVSYLFYLIRFCFCSSGLYIQNFGNAVTKKYVMAPANSFLKTKVNK